MGSIVTGRQTPSQLLSGIGANTTIICPAGYSLLAVSLFNSTANAVTGGVKIGTTSGAVDVVAAQAVAANACLRILDAALLLKYFSPTVDQTLFIQAVAAWNSAAVNFKFTFNLEI